MLTQPIFKKKLHIVLTQTVIGVLDGYKMYCPPAQTTVCRF